ncbi:MAG: hypothetical protein GY826_17985 [Fuerstiella sp.]|nr:hypothetical protein [Fuerstiella sp.]
MSVLRWSGVDPKDLFARYDEAPPLVDIRVLSGWLRRAAARGMIRDVDFKATAMLILTSMHGPAMLTDMLEKHPTGHTQSEYAAYMVNVLLQGLMPRHKNS